MKPYKDSIEMYVLGEVDELIAQFDEGLASINNLLASRYIRQLRTRAERF